MLLPDSFRISRTVSCCVSSRASPRNVPSTSRKYRILQPSVISLLQYAIILSHIAIDVKGPPGVPIPASAPPLPRAANRNQSGHLSHGPRHTKPAARKASHLPPTDKPPAGRRR